MVHTTWLDLTGPNLLPYAITERELTRCFTHDPTAWLCWLVKNKLSVSEDEAACLPACLPLSGHQHRARVINTVLPSSRCLAHLEEAYATCHDEGHIQTTISLILFADQTLDH